MIERKKINILRGKKILLLAPHFYDYYIVIKKELEKLGATVIWAETYIFLEDFRNNKNFIDVFFRFMRNPCYRKKHTKNILHTIQSEDYKFDLLIVISVFSPSPKIITLLKEKNPYLKSYIYFWDSFSTWNFKYQMKYFDYKYSFDRNDCKKWSHVGLKYLPLFWSEKQLRDRNENFTYDLVHIGSLHPKYKERLFMVSELYNIANIQKLESFIYLVSDVPKGNLLNFSFKQLLKWLFNVEYRNFANEIRMLPNYDSIVKTKQLSQDKVHEIEKNARCIVDINIDRAGIAMRIIAALANGQKIITNNKYIINESFYNPKNICVINRNDVKIDKEWLFASTSKLDMSAVRIDNWLKFLLQLDTFYT